MIMITDLIVEDTRIPMVTTVTSLLLVVTTFTTFPLVEEEGEDPHLYVDIHLFFEETFN